MQKSRTVRGGRFPSTQRHLAMIPPYIPQTTRTHPPTHPSSKQILVQTRPVAKTRAHSTSTRHNKCTHTKQTIDASKDVRSVCIYESASNPNLHRVETTATNVLAGPGELSTVGTVLHTRRNQTKRRSVGRSAGRSNCVRFNEQEGSHRVEDIATISEERQKSHSQWQ